MVGDVQSGTLPSPRFIGLAPAGLNDGPALKQVAHLLPYQELYADKAYEYLKRMHGLPFTVMTPVKKPKSQTHLDAADAWLSCASSRGCVNPSSPSSIGSRRKPASRGPARYVLPRVFSSMSSAHGVPCFAECLAGA